jgi:putative ABC transport system ATP-binding protein
MMNTHAVDISGIAKAYAGTPILRDATLCLRPGDSAAIVGRSGCGKSTLLKIIAGIEQADAGRIALGGMSLEHATEAVRTAHRRRHIGQVFQFFELFESLSVWDNLILPLQLNRMPVEVALLDALLARVDLLAHKKRFPDSLSGGEKQRLAVLRALVCRPALVLADEPTGNLDDANAKIIADLMFTLCREHGAALLLVTHSAELAAGTDQRYRIEHGVLLPCG